MNKEENRLDRLNALLHTLPVENLSMTLSQLDGYVTGVLACPEIIAPSEWLPAMWGETGEANFADQKAVEETIGAVMTHYNSVAEAMTRSLWIEPIYEVDPNSGETLWEPWVDGFTRGMRLRPHAWQSLLERADKETRYTITFPLIHQRKRQHHNDAFRSAGHAVHDRRPKASWGFAFQAAQNRVHPSKASRITIPIQQRNGAHLTTVTRARGV